MAVKTAVVMKVRMTLSLPLIFLLMISGVFGENWNVIYETESICALKGSTVNMSCLYTYPQWYRLINTFWIKSWDGDKINLNAYPEYKDRVEYIEDRQKKMSVLRLHNITENDERAYYFRLISETEGQKWYGLPGIQLKVSALQVKAPQLVLEKETVNLTCETTCSLTDGFIWYKNGQTLKIQSETLQLQSERSDSGRYSCAVRGHQHLPSPAVSITVMYPPQNTSVSINGSGEIVEGDSVTLSCSSDSNPPALNFSWFKENQSSAVGSGQSFIISSFNSSHSGRYYCEAQNKHGSQRSASVSVSVISAGGQKTVLYAAAGIGAALICICIIIVVIKITSRKTGDTGVQRDVSKQENNSTAVTDQTSTKPSKTADPDDLVYSSVTHSRPRKHQRAGDEDEVEYASVQHHRNTGNTTAVAGCQNGNTVSAGSNAETVDDSSVIYSSIKVA